MSFLLIASATILCPHLGKVSVTPSNGRVLLGGVPALVLPDLSTVAGCLFQVPIGTGTKPQPCVKVQWSLPAARVKINGQPALLQSSSGVCQSVEQIPQGPPTIVLTQVRVRGQ
jgi:hypothetical protein